MFDPVQLLLVLIGGLLAALGTYLVHRNLQSKKAALEFILTYEVHDKQWVERRTVAIDYLVSLSEKDCAQVAESWSNRSLPPEHKAGLGAVVDWLNHLELVAIAIRNKSLHRATYLKWNGEIPENWSRAQLLINAMRGTNRGSANLFENIQALANDLAK